MASRHVVVDGSVMIEVLLDTARGRLAAAILADAETSTLDLQSAEVFGGLAVLAEAGVQIDIAAASAKMAAFPAERFPSAPLYESAWPDRADWGPALYVAAAGFLSAELVTAEEDTARLASSRGVAAVLV